MLRWLLPLILILCVDHVTSRKANKEARRLTGFEIIEGLCMNDRSDILVYRYRNDSYVYVAFDALKTGRVDVFTWEIIKSSHGTFISTRMKEDRVYAVDFRKNVNRDHVIGGTSKRHVKKFKSRLKRKMNHCKALLKKKKHCKISAIQSLFIRIDMREVHYRKNPYEEDCASFYDRKDRKDKKKRKGDKKTEKEGKEE
ncbi:hypothetical protein ACF0H5_017116 [Mactra antiquata]